MHQHQVSGPSHGESRDEWMALVDAIEELFGANEIDQIVAAVIAAARRLADGVCFVLRDGDVCRYIDEDAIAPLWKGRGWP